MKTNPRLFQTFRIIGAAALLSVAAGASATNFKCDANHAVACEKLCTAGGGSWSSTDNSCSDAARVGPRPVWPTMLELARLNPSLPKNTNAVSRPAIQPVPSASTKE